MQRRARDVVVGGAAAVVAFGAVPAVLVALVGLPVPARWDRAAVLSTRGLFDLLAVAAWLAWAACAWPLLRSVIGHVRRRESTAPAGARLAEHLAVRIAAAALALTPVGLAATAAAGAAPLAPGAPGPVAGGRPPTVVAVPSPDGPADSAAPADLGAAHPGPVASAPGHYTVAAGDTLWSIAMRTYGEGADWTAIAAVNLGHRMVDGSTFVDPSVIRPGWVLDLPALDGSTPVTAPSRPPGSTPSPARRRAVDPLTAASHVPPRPARPHSPTEPAPGGGAPFPSLAALGFGTMMAALVARRARQSRRLRRLSRPEGMASPPVSDAAAELAGALEPFADLPLADRVELAVRHLSGALESAGRIEGVPAVELVRAGPDGVEVRLADPVDWVPPGWQPAGASGWRLPVGDRRALVADAGDAAPLLPLLLPLGDDDRGTWLLPVAPGSCVAVLGGEAGPMLAALSLGAGSWSWAEQVLVTGDSMVAERASPPSPLPGPASRATTQPAVLFVGDPARLSPPARAHCAVLTAQPVTAADRTVLVDDRAATVHPLGLTIRPHLLDPARAPAVAELLAGPPVPPATVSEREPDTAVRRSGSAPSGAAVAGLAPGPAEVRLLVAIPRIDGLQGELPAKRARRAVELVAYLALHRPDPVTGDRLRTRVLGSEDADAAAKTLFNTAGAARRSLGADADGRPLLPVATRAGQYRLSAAVTVDVVRAGELAVAGAAAEDPDLAMALLREALDLIEAEPLSGLLTGYAWWRAEGHEQRVADVLVDAACRLGRLAASAGHLDLARWAVDRGRLVDPYSEALARAAMGAAAAAGDAARLRQEWVRCLRLVDEVDPGGLPSSATERLYAELRRRLPEPGTADPRGDGWAPAARAAAGPR